VSPNTPCKTGSTWVCQSQLNNSPYVFTTGDPKQAGAANGDAAAEDGAEDEAPVPAQRRVLTAEELLAEAEEQVNIDEVTTTQPCLRPAVVAVHQSNGPQIFSYQQGSTSCWKHKQG
jgi:hypothetical protein